MSGDLISRERLLEDFRNTITEQSDTIDWLNMIARQPTAFDVTNIVSAIDNNVPGITNMQIMMIQDIIKTCGVE